MIDDDKDGLASEYVLGSLDADERAQVEALMVIDQDFAATVRHWERRLGELNVLVSAVEPSSAVWDRIKARLPHVAASETVHMPEVPQPAAPEASLAGAEVVDLTQRMRHWRARAVLAGALAACLAAVMVLREVRPQYLPPAWRQTPQIVERVIEKPVEVVKEVVREVPSAQPAQFVAVFQKDDQSPAFLMSVDTEKRIVTVRQVSAEQLADKSYELWIVAAGAAPRSLGIIGKDEYTVRATLAGYDPTVINDATYGISLEPLGGSPTGAPTGPVIHAKLIQVTPSQTP